MPKGKGVQADQTFLKKEGAGTGHYHMPKDKLEERTALFEQRALAGTQGKEGAGNSGRLQGCHEVI